MRFSERVRSTLFYQNHWNRKGNEYMDENLSTSELLKNAVRLMDHYAEVILSEDTEKIAYNMPRITELLNLIFPLVIKDYELPAFEGRQDEISIWVDLLGQIVNTMTGSDTFAKIDILCAVLKPDLEEHIQILQENGL